MLITSKFLMQQALSLAYYAFQENEIPVGAIITNQYDQVIAQNYNKTMQYGDPTAHAEVLTIRDACKVLNSRYLYGCKLYVTLEPCLMCLGAIIESRIDFLFYGAIATKSNVSHTILLSNYKIEYCGGICADESASLLKRFFVKLRN